MDLGIDFGDCYFKKYVCTVYEKDYIQRNNF